MTEIEFYSIEATAPVRSALVKVRGSKSRPLFVLENGCLAGVFFEAEARKFLLNGGSLGDPVGKIAKPTPVVPETEPETAPALFEKNKVRILPVVNAQNKLVGIVRADDGIQIRKLERADMAAVLDFFDRMDSEGRAFFNHGDWNRVATLDWLIGNDPNELYFGAFDQNGGMSGLLLLIRLNTGTPWLGIALRGDCKGMGQGERLLQFADDYAEPRGYGGIFLTTSIANLRGQGLYEKMGYQRQGIHNSGEILFFKPFRHTV